MSSALTSISSFFFFNDTATTEIYTLSLHDALPISTCSTTRISDAGAESRPVASHTVRGDCSSAPGTTSNPSRTGDPRWARSEEHTSELQSRLHLVCRLLLEKKKKTTQS